MISTRITSGSRSGLVGPRAARRRRRLALATLAIIVAVAGVAAVPLDRWQMERSRQAGLREVESRIDVGRDGDAYRLARQLEERMPHDAEIQRALLRLTYLSNVRTIPQVRRCISRDYADTDGPWQLFGTSPIDNTCTVRCVALEDREGRVRSGRRTFSLGRREDCDPARHRDKSARHGVRVARGGKRSRRAAELPGYWIDTI